MFRAVVKAPQVKANASSVRIGLSAYNGPHRVVACFCFAAVEAMNSAVMTKIKIQHCEKLVDGNRFWFYVASMAVLK